MTQLRRTKRAPTALCVTSATIRVSNLRLRTYIGFNLEERKKQQDVVINIDIEHRLHPGVLEDEVEQALDYKNISKAVISHVENGRFLLLEKLASDILAICGEDEAVTRIVVTVDKPHALRFADSVSVTLTFEAPADTAIEENI